LYLINVEPYSFFTSMQYASNRQPYERWHQDGVELQLCDEAKTPGLGSANNSLRALAVQAINIIGNGLDALGNTATPIVLVADTALPDYPQ
jgi:hypothetical protein